MEGGWGKERESCGEEGAYHPLTGPICNLYKIGMCKNIEITIQLVEDVREEFLNLWFILFFIKIWEKTDLEEIQGEEQHMGM